MLGRIIQSTRWLSKYGLTHDQGIAAIRLTEFLERTTRRKLPKTEREFMFQAVGQMPRDFGSAVRGGLISLPAALQMMDKGVVSPMIDVDALRDARTQSLSGGDPAATESEPDRQERVAPAPPAGFHDSSDVSSSPGKRSTLGENQDQAAAFLNDTLSHADVPEPLTEQQQVVLASFIWGAVDASAQRARVDEMETIGSYLALCAKHLGADPETVGKVAAIASSGGCPPAVMAGGSAYLRWRAGRDPGASRLLAKLLGAV